MTTSQKQEQLEERILSNIRAVTNIPPNTVTSLSEDYIKTAVKNIAHAAESYAATREREVLIKSLLDHASWSDWEMRAKAADLTEKQVTQGEQ